MQISSAVLVLTLWFRFNAAESQLTQHAEFWQSFYYSFVFFIYIDIAFNFVNPQ